ncbi:hypothetical protein B566_EDAN016186 [Ephemera danica]|nr:hypothetical protein B566_EDAN016186 [Ephemera danica]
MYSTQCSSMSSGQLRARVGVADQWLSSSGPGVGTKAVVMCMPAAEQGVADPALSCTLVLSVQHYNIHQKKSSSSRLNPEISRLSTIVSQLSVASRRVPCLCYRCLTSLLTRCNVSVLGASSSSPSTLLSATVGTQLASRLMCACRNETCVVIGKEKSAKPRRRLVEKIERRKSVDSAERAGKFVDCVTDLVILLNVTWSDRVEYPLHSWLYLEVVEVCQDGLVMMSRVTGEKPSTSW